MKNFPLLSIWILLICLLSPSSVWGKVSVVTTTTDLASMARAVGGDKVEVTSLSVGYENPHYVTPSLKKMSIANQADLFVEVGLDLEIWSGKVIEGARNPSIFPGRKGYVLASRGISVLEIPQVLSRSRGDLHASGNPHIWLDPIRAKEMAENIAQGLQRVDPDNSGHYKSRLKAFQSKISQAMYGPKLVGLFGASLLDRLTKKGKLISFLKKKKLSSRLQKKLGAANLYELLGGWMKAVEPLRGKKVIFYHKSWIYFTSRFGLKTAAHVEEKPGISPPASHRAYLEKLIRKEQIKVIAVASFYDTSVPQTLAQQAGAKMVVIPSMTGGVKGAKDYISTIDTIIQSLVKAQTGQ